MVAGSSPAGVATYRKRRRRRLFEHLETEGDLPRTASAVIQSGVEGWQGSPPPASRCSRSGRGRRRRDVGLVTGVAEPLEHLPNRCQAALVRRVDASGHRVRLVYGAKSTETRHVQRSAPPAVPAQAPDAEEPAADHQPRAGLSRGRDAEGALPRLPRRTRAGGDRDDDDGRLRLGRPRQPAGLQQPSRLEGRDRRLDADARRRVPRARLRGDDPAHPPRAPHPLGQGRLAAGGLGRPRARGRAPGLPEEGRGLGYRPDHRGLCRRGGAHAGGRARRNRDPGLRPPDGPVLVAADQRARRALRRQPRQSAPLHLRHAEGDPRPRRRRLHRRHPLHRRRGAAGRPDQGRRAGDFPPPQALRHGRLPQRGEGPYRHRRRADRRDPRPGHAVGAAPRLRRRGPRRHQLPHLPRRQDPGRRDGPLSPSPAASSTWSA